jgi:hypothetical protein
MELIVGNYIDNVKCENFKDPETGRIRVRPLSGQGLSTHLVIECSKYERERHPIGTKFMAADVKVCVKPDGRIYLRARDQMITKI